MRQAQRPSAAIVTPNRRGRSSRTLAPLLLVAAMTSGAVGAEPTKGWQAATAPPGARLGLSDPNVYSELEPWLGLAPTGVPLNLSHWRARARKRSWERRERAMRDSRVPILTVEAACRRSARSFLTDEAASSAVGSPLLTVEERVLPCRVGVPQW